MRYTNKVLIPVFNEETKSAFIDEKSWMCNEVQVANSPFYFGSKTTNFLASGTIRNFVKFCLGSNYNKSMEVNVDKLKLVEVLVEYKAAGDDVAELLSVELDVPFTKGQRDAYILQRLETPVGMVFDTKRFGGESVNVNLNSIDLNINLDVRGDILTLRQTKNLQCKVVGFRIAAEWDDHNFSYTA